MLNASWRLLNTPLNTQKIPECKRKQFKTVQFLNKKLFMQGKAYFSAKQLFSA